MVEEFDWKRGFKFSTYATPCIRSRLKTFCIQKNKDLSLDAPMGFGEEDAGCLYDSVSDKKSVSPEEKANINIIRKSFDKAAAENNVTRREAEALILLYGLRDGIMRGFKEVGDIMNITRD